MYVVFYEKTLLEGRVWQGSRRGTRGRERVMGPLPRGAAARGLVRFARGRGRRHGVGPRTPRFRLLRPPFTTS